MIRAQTPPTHRPNISLEGGLFLDCSHACACAGCCRRGIGSCRCLSLLRCNALQRTGECLILIDISRVSFSERAVGCDHTDARFKAQMLIYTRYHVQINITRSPASVCVPHSAGASQQHAVFEATRQFLTISKRVAVSAHSQPDSGYHETAHRQFQQMRLGFPTTPFVYTP